MEMEKDSIDINIDTTIDNNVDNSKSKKEIIDDPEPNRKKTDASIIEDLTLRGFSKIDKINKKISKLYIIAISCIITAVLILAVLLILKVPILYVFIFIFVAIPIVLLGIITLLIRLVLDKKRIMSNLVLKLSTYYVRAIFFLPNRKLKESFFRITELNKFEIDNGLYLVSEKAIWFDDNNNPTIFYFYGLPNPLLFNFSYWVEKFLETTNSNIFNNENNETYDDLENVVNVSYASTELKLYRGDKLVNELHKGDNMKIRDIIIIVLLVVILIVVIIGLFMNGNTQPVETVANGVKNG